MTQDLRQDLLGLLAARQADLSASPQRCALGTPTPLPARRQLVDEPVPIPRGRWMGLIEASTILNVDPARLRRAIGRARWSGRKPAIFEGIVARKLGARFHVFLDATWIEPESAIRRARELKEP